MAWQASKGSTCLQGGCRWLAGVTFRGGEEDWWRHYGHEVSQEGCTLCRTARYLPPKLLPS